jgi:hypothetical protein
VHTFAATDSDILVSCVRSLRKVRKMPNRARSTLYAVTSRIYVVLYSTLEAAEKECVLCLVYYATFLYSYAGFMNYAPYFLFP